MQPWQRGEAPAVLVENSQAWGSEYAQRKSQDPAFRFAWKGDSYPLIRNALKALTDCHCSYCDGYPVDAHGKEEVDHFRPKGGAHPEFHPLAYEWTNLFYCCSGCNDKKKERWSEQLLRPDAQNYTFLRYFEYETDSGELKPNPLATANDQQKASESIRIFGLNRPGLCTLRRRHLQDADPDRPFRFLQAI